jgi:lupus La protein
MAEADKVESNNGNSGAEAQDNNSQEDLTKLERDIIRQLEYYFSENNLRRDKFLIKKIAETEDGWVELSVMLTFNRLKSITEDPAAICAALDKSANGIVQVSEDRLKVRRHPENPLPEFNEARRKETQARTAYAKGFPLDSDLSTLIEYFNNNFDNVEQVIMRKYFCSKTKNHLFKGSVFITFSSKELAEAFVAKPELKYNEKELLRYTQTKYFEIKKLEREEFDKKKKARIAEKQEEEEKEKFSLPKQAVVHFSGVENDEITREDIKARVTEIDESLDMAFIHFNKGEKEGDLRFNKENDGSKLIEQLAEGKVRSAGVA